MYYAMGKALGEAVLQDMEQTGNPQEGNDHNRKYAEGQCEPAL